MKETEGFNEV